MKKRLLILTAVLPAMLLANDSISKREVGTTADSQVLERAMADPSPVEGDSLQKPYILDDMPLVRAQ